MNSLHLNTHAIHFDSEKVNAAAFAQYLYDSADIVAFWNYLPNLFCVKTMLDAYELSDKILPFFPQGQYWIAPVEATETQGRLTDEAWSWFYLEHHEKTHAPPKAPPLLPTPRKMK